MEKDSISVILMLAGLVLVGKASQSKDIYELRFTIYDFFRCKIPTATDILLSKLGGYVTPEEIVNRNS